MTLFVKSNVSKTAFAKEHKILWAALNDIISTKNVIEHDDCKIKGERMRKSKFVEDEEDLVRRSKHGRSKNVPISVLILKKKKKSSRIDP